MKIETVVCGTVSRSLEHPVHFGIGPFSTFSATIVRVRTDTGLVGTGECIVRKAPGATKALVDELITPVVRGRELHDVEGIWDDLFGELRGWGHYRGFLFEAMSGVDTAIWDALAQEAGLPLYKMLGGAGRSVVPCYASSVYFKPVDELVAEARAQVDAGHNAVKVKVGRPSDLGGWKADVAAVEAVHEALGPGVDLMLDANCAYDAATAIQVGRRLEEAEITWIEEPVPPDDLDGYEKVRSGQPIPIAAGESEFGVFGFRELIGRGAIDILQPDVARVGGPTAARRVGALAHTYNLRMAPHTGFSGGVSHLAALHVAASTPNLMTYEYFYADNPIRDLFAEPFPLAARGGVELPQRPGLGLDLHPDVVREIQST